MSVEEFRNSCPGDRNEDFYRGSFNCARGNLNNAIESLGFAIEYFIDMEDPDYKVSDNCVLGLISSLDKIWDRMNRQMSKENING